MKSKLLSCAGFAIAVFSLNAHAVPGEYWEISAQMEMPGMPFAMPAQKSKVCMPKGGESDPNRTQDKDSKCDFTDIQRSGNTVKFKGTCVNGHGDKMKVSGETTHDANSFKTKMQMSSEGHGGQMSMNSSGKRIGGSCDSEEMVRKVQAQAEAGKKQAAMTQKDFQAHACDTRNSDQLLLAGGYYGGNNPACKNKKEYCQAVRNKVQHDPHAYDDLAIQEEQGRKYAAQGAKNIDETSVIHICGLDMGSLKSAVCKNSVHRGPQDFMDQNCSAAQAKEYREYARQQEDCARDYTAPDQRAACVNLAKCGSDTCGQAEETTPKDSGKSTTNTVLDGAKKLRGFLPF
jgi:hypothetical protein